MTDRVLTYDKVMRYFEQLVEKSNYLTGFVGFSDRQLTEIINGHSGLQDYSLILFGYSGTLDGNKQRTLASRTISFAILKPVKSDDFEEQYATIGEAERIGLHVMSRINYDSQLPDHFLYNSFEKDSVRFNEVMAKDTDNLYGMEFHFRVKNSEPLTISPFEWADLKNLCNE